MTAVLVLAALVGFGGAAVAAPSAPSAPFTWPPADITPVYETAEQLTARVAGFSAREVELVPQVVRGATDVRPGVWGHEAAGVFDGLQYVDNFVDFTTPRGPANFFIQIHAPGFFTTTPAQMCELTTCTGSTRTASGDLLLFTEYTAGSGGRTVYDFRPNGEVVYVSTSYATVSNRQLARLATDRAFTFTS
ncbi:hypothetical protein ALI22I_39385 [Saccharothrix sp. ALI-22-I]|nr:hypothetical protein ALI22I_39385 [Saccharothrix sp. ALI-22-I]